MAEDQVEALVVERQPLGLGAHRRDLEPEPVGGGAQSASSIPGEMSVAVERSIAPSCSRLSEK